MRKRSKAVIKVTGHEKSQAVIKVTGHDLFVCVEVLWPSQPNGVMLSVVSLPYHILTGQA